MIRKVQSPFVGHVRVVFELPACIWADRISLVGDFNQWDEEATPLVQDRSGIWRATVDLPVGRTYRFRYQIDGQWRTDFHADGYEENGYGSQNSLIFAELPESELDSSLVREERSRRLVAVGPLRQRPTPTRQFVAAA